MKDEGHNPDEYLFEALGKRAPVKRQPMGKSNKIDDENDETINQEDTNDIKKDTNNTPAIELIADEVGKGDKEGFAKLNKKPNMAPPNLANNDAVENEDSLNLTIGEDEEKIFQDEVRIHLLIL